MGDPGTEVLLLATHQVSSICGTTASAATYDRRIRPDPRGLPAADGVRVRGRGPGSAFFVVIVTGFVVRTGGGVLGFWG